MSLKLNVMKKLSILLLFTIILIGCEKNKEYIVKKELSDTVKIYHLYSK